MHVPKPRVLLSSSKQQILVYPTPTFCKITWKDFAIPMFMQSKQQSDSKAFLHNTQSTISLSLFVPYLYGAEQRISKNTLVVFWSNCKINISCYNQNAPRHTCCILFYFLSSQAAVPVAPPQDCLLMTDQSFQLTCLLGIMRYGSHMNNTNSARQKISLDLDSTFPGKQGL